MKATKVIEKMEKFGEVKKENGYYSVGVNTKDGYKKMFFFEDVETREAENFSISHFEDKKVYHKTYFTTANKMFDCIERYGIKEEIEKVEITEEMQEKIEILKNLEKNTSNEKMQTIFIIKKIEKGISKKKLASHLNRLERLWSNAVYNYKEMVLFIQKIRILMEV